MIYGPEGENPSFTKLVVSSTAFSLASLVLEQKAPRKLACELEERELTAGKEWRGLSEKYTPENNRLDLQNLGNLLQQTADVINCSHDLWENGRIEYLRKVYKQMAGINPGFTYNESLIERFYSDLSVDHHDKKEPSERNERFATLIHFLNQLDAGFVVIDTDPLDKINITFKDERGNFYNQRLAEVHTMARQFVISQISWMLTREVTDNMSWRRVELFNPEEMAIKRMEEMAKFDLSEDSRNEILQYAAAHLNYELANRLEIVLMLDNVITSGISQELYHNYHKFQARNPKLAEQINDNADIHYRCSYILALAKTFITTDQIYTGMHPQAMWEQNVKKINKQIRKLREKHPNITDEVFQPISDFEKSMSRKPFTFYAWRTIT